MRPTLQLPRLVGPVTGIALALSLLAACGSEAPDSGGDASSPVTSPSPTAGTGEAPSTPSTTPSPEESPSRTTETDPTPAPSSAVPSATPTRLSSPGATGLRALLLTGAAMPGLNESLAWTKVKASTTEPERFALCHRTSMLNIGASEVAVRSYTNPEDPTAYAGHLVAQFPDPETARRALAVLGSWRGSCGQRLSAAGNDASVGDPQPVADAAETARWYLVVSGAGQADADTATFESTGYVLVGSRIALLVMRHDGQDHNYLPGEDPMVAALVRASTLLS